MNPDNSTISVPGDWRVAMPSSPKLLDELQRAATAQAEPLDIEVEWPRIGRYQACGELGQGGMSTVWKAYDAELGRRVAIKLLHPSLTSEHGVRLWREAWALARLSHPNVVHVYEAIRIEGLTALVMELVAGVTLRKWQTARRPGFRECVAVYLQAGHGLAAVHAAGLVHRDFKPENCIIDADGRVRVLDFGLVARATDDETVEDLDPPSQDDALEARVTRTGARMGTVAYMPPERLGGGPSVSAAGDQFSFCVSLYEAIYGERPFAGTTERELAEAIEQGDVGPVHKGVRACARVRQILLRGLAADPERRWPSMEELLAELGAAVGRRPGRWLWLAAALASGVATLMTTEALDVSDERSCAGAAAELHGVWDREHRRAAEAAMLGTGTRHATDTWARLEPLLDDYARGWVAKHTEVCEATRVSGAQTEEHMGLRMRCLSGRRLALGEVVGVLRYADEATRAHAVELVAGLPALSACDDLEALEAETPLPGDAEDAAAVEAARGRLARARARRQTGDDTASEADAIAVVHEAERLGYEPLLAEALLERGELRARWPEHGSWQVEPPLAWEGTGMEEARRQQAERDLEDAYHLATRIEHRVVETRAASLLARLMARAPSRGDEAERWSRLASSLAERPGTERVLVAEAASARGHVLSMRSWGGAHERQRHEVIGLHQRALALYEDALGSSHVTVAETLESMGDVWLRSEDSERAEDEYDRALALYEVALGSSHPAVATVAWKLGKALAKQQQHELALEAYARALEIQRAAFGDWHPDVARTWTWIGMALHAQGRLADALALHRLALDMTVSTTGRYDEAVIGILCEIGFVLRDAGRIEDALGYYEESVSLREAVFPGSVAIVLRNIGHELLEHGRPDLAEGYYRRVLARYETERVSVHAVAELLVCLGEAEVAQRDFEGAVEHAERALGIYEAAGSSAPGAVERARAVLERAHVESRGGP